MNLFMVGEAESLMLISEKAVLGVCCSYCQYYHINLDLAFTFTFVTHRGHFWFKKVKLDCSPRTKISLGSFLVLIIIHIICE